MTPNALDLLMCALQWKSRLEMIKLGGYPALRIRLEDNHEHSHNEEAQNKIDTPWPG
jgi:hypothetical protein